MQRKSWIWVKIPSDRLLGEDTAYGPIREGGDIAPLGSEPNLQLEAFLDQLVHRIRQSRGV
jgi:hypothetical protein